jgi:hypothetical protein
MAALQFTQSFAGGLLVFKYCNNQLAHGLSPKKVWLSE